MTPLEKVNLIHSIAVELQRRMTYDEIDLYLTEYGINKLSDGYGSKKVYVQKALEGVLATKILKIAEELGLLKSESFILAEEPLCWKLGFFKMFISHLTANKSSATNLKICLEEYAISGFVAHEDIEPSKEWMVEIERALFSMNGLCAIVTSDFIKSHWCDQEVGVAIGRKILIVTIRKGADPYGLFGKYQGIQSKDKDSNKIAEEIFKIVATNEKSKSTYAEMIRNLVLNSKNAEEGLKWIALLEKIPSIEIAYIAELHSKFYSNNNLNNKPIFDIVNRIFKKYELSPVNHKTFMVSNLDLDDDLPF